MQASVDLHSPKTKTCAHAKKSRNHTEARKYMNLWLLTKVEHLSISTRSPGHPKIRSPIRG